MMGKRAVVKELEKVKENCIVLFEREAELKFKYEALLKETEEMRRQDVDIRPSSYNCPADNGCAHRKQLPFQANSSVAQDSP